MTKKKRLVALRKACKEDGVKLIELTYRDGRKSRISDRAAIAAVMTLIIGVGVVLWLRSNAAPQDD